MLTLYHSEVLKRELGYKAVLLISCSVFLPTIFNHSQSQALSMKSKSETAAKMDKVGVFL